MNKEEITISKAQQMVDQWIKTIGVRYFSELTNLAILTEAVGELARIMARTYGDQSFKQMFHGKLLGWPPFKQSKPVAAPQKVVWA